MHIDMRIEAYRNIHPLFHPTLFTWILVIEGKKAETKQNKKTEIWVHWPLVVVFWSVWMKRSRQNMFITKDRSRWRSRVARVWQTKNPTAQYTYEYHNRNTNETSGHHLSEHLITDWLRGLANTSMSGTTELSNFTRHQQHITMYVCWVDWYPAVVFLASAVGVAPPLLNGSRSWTRPECQPYYCYTFVDKTYMFEIDFSE